LTALDLKGQRIVPLEAIEYVSNFRRCIKHEVYGFVFAGTLRGVSKVMSLMVARYMRNFVDANLCPLETALEASHKQRTVIAIPDFWTRPTNEYMQGRMLSLLIEREAAEKQTIMGIADIAACCKNLGPVMEDFMKNAYKVVER
jgi:hypothetical protein